MQTIVDQVRALISGDKETDEAKVFEAMGYVPKLAEGAVVTTAIVMQAGIDAAVLAALETAKETAKTELETAVSGVTENINGLVELCTLTKRVDLLGGFINEKLSLDDAKVKLLAAQTPGDPNHVISTVSGVSSGGPNALLDDVKERAEKKK